MRTKLILMLSLSLLIASYAFAGSKSQDKLKRKWMLVEFQDFSKEEMMKLGAFIDFTQIEKGGHASMGCNVINFKVKTKICKRISFGEAMSTMMFCQEAMRLEDAFKNFLPKVKKYKVKGHYLTLSAGKNGKMLLVAEDWD